MKSFLRNGLGLIGVFMVVASFSGHELLGDEAPSADAAAASAEEKKNDLGGSVSEDGKTLTFPGFTVDREKMEVRMDAEVCLESGILEYVVCLPETFEHEAIFVTKAKPELLHAGLLLIGLTPKPQPPGLEMFWWDQALKAADSRVRIEVEWQFGDQLERVNLSDMMRNRAADADFMGMDPQVDPDEVEEVKDAWIFTGSFMHKDRQSDKRIYAANLGGVIVGIWPNPTTVIQYGLPSENPYRGDHLGMEIREENVPAKGTKVKLVFSKFPKSELPNDDTPKPKSPKTPPAKNDKKTE